MRTSPIAGAWLSAALLGAVAPRQDRDAALTDVDRKVMAELAAVKETPAAVYHYRAGTDAKELDADVAANGAALAALGKSLAMTYRGRVHVFLYRDVDEMRRLTGTGGGTVAFSTGTVSVHQAHDFRGVHEFVHIFALQFERGADTAGADGFVTEGLATYLAESDEGVPIHDWAAVDAKAGVLPASLTEFRRTWPQGCAPGVHPYHVAGSFVGFLVDRFGIAKVKRWYVDSTEAHQYFGEGIAQLEREWREFLAKRTVERAREKQVMKKLGLDLEPMPAAWATVKGTPLFDGKSLSGLSPQDPAKWSVRDGLLVGSNDAPWTQLATTRSFGKKIGVRAKLRLASGNAVKLVVNGGKEAIFATWSSYASAGEGFSGNDHVKIPVGKWVDLVVVDEAGRARVYLDGTTVFDLPGVWSGAGEGSLGLGVERGVLELKEWVAFDA
jgi:hypothetical protein